MSRISRRELIKIAGSTVVMGADGRQISVAAQGPGKGLGAFDHVVVLMLENRSFDNLLGHLYAPGDVSPGQSFDGVTGKDLSNPIPSNAPDSDRNVVPVWSGFEMDNPNPDPGEEYPHVSTQLFGTVNPEDNLYRSAAAMLEPFNTPNPAPAVAPMNGFVTDYINNFVRTEHRMPTYDEYRVIMHCYRPEVVPVISTLAREFAVCDHWFCDVPSQTFANRAFFHAASSAGAVINVPFAHWARRNSAETIFERIGSARERGLSWKVYFDEEDVFPITALIHYPRLQTFLKTNFFTMQRFFDDAGNGTLPSYCFIEPRLFLNHNDMHPPIRIAGRTQRSSILAGEALINKVYDAVRLSNSATGSNFQNTLLVITFDEHGGCFDHVSPSAASPPDPVRPTGQFGFKFERLGVRVPTVLVSAYIEPRTIINTEFSHSSMVRTLTDKWNLGHLTERDRAAANFSEAFNRAAPRPLEDWPVVRPREMPPNLAWANNHDHPPNALQRDIVGLAVAVGGDSLFHPGEVITVVDAIARMRKELGWQEQEVKK